MNSLHFFPFYRKVSLTQGRSMKNLMGIELDPMDNIIVATSHDKANESNCDLEIFNAKGRKLLDCTSGDIKVNQYFLKVSKN